MKYHDLVKLFGKIGFFDFASVVQLVDERRDNIRIQIYRWRKAEKLLPLRRGMYAFPPLITAGEVSPAELANHLYRPSYISAAWAMGFYGMVPEKVVTYTNVTSRVSKSFSNYFGTFKYQSVKEAGFFGYRSLDIGGKKVIIAEPEKALLDFWHLEKGAWGKTRMIEMRFQNAGIIDNDKLYSYAEKYHSPRLIKAVDVWKNVMGSLEKGTVTL